MSDNSIFWLQFIAAKSFEAWLAILGGVAYVWYKSGATTRLGKAVEAGISGVMSMALGPDLIAASGYPPTFIHFMIAVGGFLVLDFGTSFFSDKAELASITRDFIRKWLKIDKP